ncbi:MAG: 30S ribosomal protein S6 [bacterium]|nr:30S ribosomal protein S6 [bacterium]
MTEEKSSVPTDAGTPPLRKEELKEEGKEARIYEVGYLIVPTVTEEELPREVTALKDVLEKEKAAVIAEEFPKLRALAYEMQKRSAGAYQNHTSAYFGWVKFEGTAESIRAIEQAFKQNEKVLRYLLIKTVRENTMSAGRPPRAPRVERKEAPKDAAPSAPVSEVELDKSIEKLIAE